MGNRKIINILLTAIVFTALIFGGNGSVPVLAQGSNPPEPTPEAVPPTPPVTGNSHGEVTPAERQAAADRAVTARAAGLQTQAEMAAASAPSMDPGGIPDFFGTIPNYANSPIPASIGISGDGTGASALAKLETGGNVGYVEVTNSGTGYTDAATTVTLIGGGGTGAVLKAVINSDTGSITAINVIDGGSGYNTTPGIRKFVDSLPGLTESGANDLGQYIPIAVADTTTFPGSDYYEIALVQYARKLHKDLPPTTLRGYVQISTSVVPGKQIQLYYPDGVTPILDLAGNPVYAVDNPQYLGPLIIAGSYDPTKPAGVAGNGKPTRIKFTNYLPSGSGGDLFIPVDTTVMGAGMGPLTSGGSTCDPTIPDCASYTENRATLHLHGGNTPWISDGTPHQWTTPADEITPYPEGVSVYNVPDMLFDTTGAVVANGVTPPAGSTSNPGNGSLTFFYTNQQSARLMFYHDHAYGLTRLNVYAGEAAGYIVTDPVEQTLVNGGTIPGTSIVVPAGTIPATQIPLIIQDKTFVPSISQLAVQDPTWNWGSGPLVGGIRTPVVGDLWFPHVYMPNQNPTDIQGVNAMGRWDYGPWFWPPFKNITYGEVDNPLYPSSTNPLEGPYNPGIPNPSIVPEGFMDTQLVNGTAYPYLNVLRQAYRFRILNASNDRTINLQLYCAKSNGTMWDLSSGTLLNADAGEVKMVPAVATPGFPVDWPTDSRVGGVPDPASAGPAFIQIGTEGGLLPAPAVIPNQPVGYLYDRRNIVVLNISTKALMLGPAERADVIVDFSQLPSSCTNLILYNDAPAPVPAFDPRNDYFTGDPDLSSVGGAPTTLPGYGPNTRTIMQIRVSGTAASPYNMAALQIALPAAFAASQPAPLVPQAEYNAAYNANYPTDAYVRIQDTTMTFTPWGSTAVNNIKVTAGGSGYGTAPAVNLVGGTGSGATATANITGGKVTSFTITNGGSGYTSTGLPTVVLSGGGGAGAAGTASSNITLPLQPKAIQELFTVDYGRMNATLGVEIPNTTGINQTTIPLGYVDPTTEIIKNSDPMTPLGTLADGTQIWKITHNGVDTHAIHFHMFNVQLINRVGWDGAVRPPDPNELGWRETLRMNPLEDAIVALRPIIPVLPFAVPNSIRPFDVTLPLGLKISTTVDPLNLPVTVYNTLINYGWEYVWHCHLLGHEENDMMRPMIIAVPPEAPTNLVAATSVLPAGVKLTWDDASLNATDFTVERATDPAFTLNLVTFPVAKATGVPQTYTDTSVTLSPATLYYYRVLASVDVGGGASGYPSETVTSVPSNTARYPSNLVYLAVTSLHGTVLKVLDQPSYTLGDTVTLTAIGSTGWNFANWSGNACIQATALPTIVDGVITTIAVPDGGSGYTAVPNVKIIGGSGSGATASASLSGDIVSNPLIVTFGGSGYGPTVGISAVGSGATGTAPTVTGGVIDNTITVLTGGSGYTTPPLVEIVDPTGIGATAIATIAGGHVTAITITSGGSGYSSTPILNITSGSGATATTTVDGTGKVTAVTVVSGGINYTSAPNVSILGGSGSGALAFATINGSGVVTGITLTNNGSGYAPEVVIDPVSSTCLVTMNEDKAVTAHYAPDFPTISGNAGVAGAEVGYSDGVISGTTTADSLGNYSFTVSSSPWTGTVTPTKFGYGFLPASRVYTGITVDQTGQSYTATPITYTISGRITGNLAPNIGVGGVTLSYTDGTAKMVNTDSIGNYSLVVSYSWSGVVTPARTGVIFVPPSRLYSTVLANQVSQDYVRQAPTFSDVPFTYSEVLGGTTYSLFPYIQALFNAGYTAGCQVTPTLKYCPTNTLNRAESAVFMLRSVHGGGYLPPTTPGYSFVFNTDNWSAGPWARPWAEDMYHEGLTAGCAIGSLKFCPWDRLPRDQASVFAVRVRHGVSYVPPVATGTVFADMTNPALWSTAWAEQAYRDGLMVACGSSGGKPLFCPGTLLDRAWAAYMIVTAKNLPPVPYP